MATKMNRPESARGTIFNPKDDAGLDKPGYSDQRAYTGKTPSRTQNMDRPSGKGWWEGSHGKTPWDSNDVDLRNAAQEGNTCYGGDGGGRGGKGSRAKGSTSPRPDARGAAKPHVYNKDEDFGM
jgi:hypothetical protein